MPVLNLERADLPRRRMLDRYRGCLLGGAVGDALGYPIEFFSEGAIRTEYGPKGIQTLAQAGRPAPVSDDTQMTLFAANALVYAWEQVLDPVESLWLGYREWLGTQGDPRRMDDPAHPALWLYKDRRLHARRAPGTTCLSSISTLDQGGTITTPPNNSKGCGTVMRASPFGLAVCAAQAGEDGPARVYQLAVCDAALTHGHETAWASSGLLAQLVYHIVQERPARDYALQDALDHIGIPGDRQVLSLLKKAAGLAVTQGISDLDGIHALGEGWVADEALAIAFFCAVRYQNDFAAALRAAVNHKGDSDSTGAICGNILGAWLGAQEVGRAFDLQDLELADVIEKTARLLFDGVQEQHPPKEALARLGAGPVFGAWQATRWLGQGSCGQVFLLQREDFGIPFQRALRVIACPPRQAQAAGPLAEGVNPTGWEDCMRELTREIALMRRLGAHEHILSLDNHQITQRKDGQGWDILLQMPYLTPLSQHLAGRGLAPEQAIRLGIHMCRALERCREYGVAHQNIRPENIFVDACGAYLLGDVCLARMVQVIEGVPPRNNGYSAPETRRTGVCDTVSDLYSLGIVMYCALNDGRMPLLADGPGGNDPACLKKALALRYEGTPLPPPRHGEGPLGDIVRKACAHSRADRYNDPARLRQDLERLA